MYRLHTNIKNSLQFLASIALLLAGCSTYNPDISHGALIYTAKPDLPQMSVNAVGYFDQQGRPVLKISADIIRYSLVYADSAENITARTTLKLHIEGPVDSTLRQKLTIKHKPSLKIYHYQRLLHVPPGNYTVHLSITDHATGKHTSGSARASMAHPDSGISNLGNLRMQAKSTTGWNLQVNYVVPSRYDSLTFNIRVANASKKPLRVDAKLIRFKSDSSVARSYFEPNYEPTSLQYIGIRYDSTKIIYKKRRVLSQKGDVDIQFKLKRPPHGNYRFDVRANNKNDEQKLFKARDFAVRSANFPNIRSPREQAQPLIYLMRHQERKKNRMVMKSTHMKAIMNLTDPDSIRFALRGLVASNYWSGKLTNNYETISGLSDPQAMQNAVNDFWFNLIENKEKAEKVRTLYYRRVEEANKKFTTYKEGWKTDPGMIYILFGSDYKVNYKLPEAGAIPNSPYMVPASLPNWLYPGPITPIDLSDLRQHSDRNSMSGYEGVDLFEFYQPKPKSKTFPFTQFFLFRLFLSSDRFNAENGFNRQIQLWHSGKILHQKHLTYP